MNDPNRTQMLTGPIDPNRTIMGGAPSVKGTSMNATQTIKPVQCPVCKSFNPAAVAFCVECGLVLDQVLPEDAFGAPKVELPVFIDPSGRELILRPGSQVLGRQGDLVIDDPRVSRRHCRVTLNGSEITAEDLGSTNGTKVDDQPVAQGTASPIASEISLGGLVLKLSRPGQANKTEMLTGGKTTSIAAPTTRTPVADWVALGFPDVELYEGTASFGRRSSNQIVLSDPFVSGAHGELRLEGASAWIRDTGSTNGTWVNGEKIEPQVEVPLTPEDTVKLGEIELKLVWRNANG